MKVSLVNDGPVTFWLQIPKTNNGRKNGKYFLEFGAIPSRMGRESLKVLPLPKFLVLPTNTRCPQATEIRKSLGLVRLPVLSR